MDLAFNLILTLLLEIPVVGFFFSRKKRKHAYLVVFLANLITWALVNIIRIKTNLNLDIVQLGVVAFEGFAYLIFMRCSWKKAFLVSIVANLLSYVVTKFVYIGPDFMQKKPDIIVH
jgi:hypothetical protein